MCFLCLCQESCEALEFMFAAHIQNVLQGSALTGSLCSALSKGQHVFAFPQKQSRDQIIATFQFIWLLPRESQLSSCFWANCLLPAPPNGRQRFRVIYLPWRFLLLYSPIIYIDRFTTGPQFSYSLSYFSDLKNPEAQEELRGWFQDLWELLKFGSSASSSIHGANPLPTLRR